MAPLKKKSLLDKGSLAGLVSTNGSSQAASKSVVAAKGLAAAKIIAAKALAAKAVAAKGLISAKKLG